MWWKRKRRFVTLALEILEQKRLGPSTTYAVADFRINRLIGYFGHLSLSEISETSWRGFVIARFKERPGCKFFDDRKFLKQIMIEAHRRHWIERVPLFRLPDLPSSAAREISSVEITRLIEKAGPGLQFQINIARLMGLRLREMMYLRWDSIEWDRKTVRLLPSDTKTRTGREAPIPPDLFPEFLARFNQSNSPYVFPKKTNRLKPQHSNRTAWRTCKRKANVKCRWHDWRHTAASEMLRRGNPAQIVRRILGMSERVLTQIYYHVNLTDLHSVAESMPRIALKSI